DHDACFRDPLERDRTLGDGFAEGDAIFHAPAHFLQRAFGETDNAHAMVDAAGSEPALRDVESATFAEKKVIDWNAHMVENDLHVSVRRVVITENGQVPQNVDA